MQKGVLIVGNEKFIEDVGASLLPLGAVVEVAHDEEAVARKSKKGSIKVIIFDEDSYGEGKLCKRIVRHIRASKKAFMWMSSNKSTFKVLIAKEAGAADYVAKPYNKREFITRFNAIASEKTRIPCLGGGTGLFNLLMGLKTLPNTHLTSIVSTADSGGSSGRLRVSFGVLPPGDIRRSLVALSNAPELMNKVMQFRFRRGMGIKGHNFGNLFLVALAEIKGSMTEAVKDLGELLYIQGIVVPVSATQTTLCALFQDGTVVKGESDIDLARGRKADLHIRKLWHEPESECGIDAYSSIINSDIVTIGPGDLFTSVVTNLVVRNVKEAIAASRGKKIYICNLMTKPGETAGYDACGHIKEIVKYMGGDHLDYVIISNTALSDEAVRLYAKKGQVPVRLGSMQKIRKLTKAKIILADVSHETELVRHDSEKLKNKIAAIAGL
jgi:uncharacterized cofD-like protein